MCLYISSSCRSLSLSCFNVICVSQEEPGTEQHFIDTTLQEVAAIIFLQEMTHITIPGIRKHMQTQVYTVSDTRRRHKCLLTYIVAHTGTCFQLVFFYSEPLNITSHNLIYYIYNLIYPTFFNGYVYSFSMVLSL